MANFEAFLWVFLSLVYIWCAYRSHKLVTFSRVIKSLVVIFIAFLSYDYDGHNNHKFSIGDCHTTYLLLLFKLYYSVLIEEKW